MTNQQAELYEIVPCPRGRIAIAPHPLGDESLMGELTSFKNRGVTDVVSLLTPQEETALGLRFEADFCQELMLGFHRHPIPDRGIPTQPAFEEFVSSLQLLLRKERFLAVHCRAGIGRSAVTIAALLCRLGIPADEGLLRISQERGFDVPDTKEQREFLKTLGW